MIRISCLLLFVLFTLKLTGAELGYTFDEDARGWLKLHNPAKWDEAQINCDTEAGAVLASPLNPQLRDALMKYVHDENGDVRELYTGVRADEQGGPLVTREGVPVRNLPVPASFDTETSSGCVVWGMQWNKLYIRNCNNLYFFVCYKPLERYRYDNVHESLNPIIVGQIRTNPLDNISMQCAANEDIIFINTELETEQLRDIINKSTRKVTIIYANQASVSYLNGASEKKIDSKQVTRPSGSKKPSTLQPSDSQRPPTRHIPVPRYPAPVSTSTIRNPADKYPLYYSNQYSQVNGRIKFYGPATWTDANNQCVRDGAILASPLTHPLLETLKAYVLGVDSAVSTIYTGVHANFSTGDYISIEGVPLTKMPVALDQSIQVNYMSSDSCLTLMTRETATVQGAKCSDKHPFVCYKRTEVNSCGTLDKEYVYNSNSGSCYKFHRKGQIWNKAYETCKSENAHLAVIDNLKESQVLRNLFKKNPRKVLQSIYFVDNTFIGLRRLSDSEAWVISKGTEATYLNWNKGEPNNDL